MISRNRNRLHQPVVLALELVQAAGVQAIKSPRTIQAVIIAAEATTIMVATAIAITTVIPTAAAATTGKQAFGVHCRELPFGVASSMNETGCA